MDIEKKILIQEERQKTAPVVRISVRQGRWRAVLLLLLLTIFLGGGVCLYKRKQYESDKIMEQDTRANNFRGDKPSKSYLKIVFDALTRKPKSATRGLVQGIVYSKDLSSILMGDNNCVFHEGNTIYGITIAKIHKDRVEFAKNGKRWIQKVGETPNPEW